MIFHIVTGDLAATQLRNTFLSDNSSSEEVVVFKDILNVGPILRTEGKSFSEMRAEFWQQVIPKEKSKIEVDDLERILMVGNELSKNESNLVWIWMAALPADICNYYFVLSYLHKYLQRLNVVNISGLPFLDGDGKLFYPKSISELLPKEVNKARKLARPISASEAENDVYEWKLLSNENAAIRVLENGKRMKSEAEFHYDKQLVGFCSHHFQKASKVVGQAITKFQTPTGDLYLGWRLQKMAEEGKILVQGDTSKTLKDFEVKLLGEDLQLELTV